MNILDRITNWFYDRPIKDIHKCKMSKELGYIVLKAPVGWFVLFGEYGDNSCQITYCPFCGVMLDE